MGTDARKSHSSSKLFAKKPGLESLSVKSSGHLEADEKTLSKTASSDYHGPMTASKQNLFSMSTIARVKRCYELMPTSSKLIVFDTQLHVKKAFHALVYNNIRAAPVWDNASQKFVGMLTITDFIRILNCYYRSQMEELEEQRIQAWRDILNYKTSFSHIAPDATLYDAVKLLCDMRIHRLPMLDPKTGNVLCILTHKRILKYLYLSDVRRPSWMDKSLEELKIGTLSNVVTVHWDTPVITALKLFLEHTVSALPVVDKISGRCVDIYSKFDVIHIAADRAYDNLDMTIFKALERRQKNRHYVPNNQANDPATRSPTTPNGGHEVIKCRITDSLNHVVDLIAKAEVHRLVIVDENDIVVGVISLSDILKHIVLTPPSEGNGSNSSSQCGGLDQGGESVSSAESFEYLPTSHRF